MRRRPRAPTLVQAAAVRPQRVELGDDALAELVAGAREREAGVGVQALERAAAAGAADAEVERGAAVTAGLAGRELAADDARLLVGGGEARRELGVVVRGRRPALDAARRLEPRDRSDEVAARDVVRRRERLAVAGRTGSARLRPGGRTGSARRRGGTRAARGRSGGRRRRGRRLRRRQRPRGAIMLARSRFRHWLMPLTMKRCSPGRT